jgi:hypothetical protein
MPHAVAEQPAIEGEPWKADDIPDMAEWRAAS